MKIYKVELDRGLDLVWTLGYYSNKNLAVKKANEFFNKEVELDFDLTSKYTHKIIVDKPHDFNGFHYGINAMEDKRYIWGVYIYEIEVDCE